MDPMRQKPLIFLTGAIPFVVGFFLIKTGFTLLVAASSEIELLSQNYPLLSLFPLLFLIVLACGIGYIKGKFVISKSTKRNIERLQNMPHPIKITQLYSTQYYCLIAGMMGLGMLLNVLGIPKDVRGFIDTAIGFALIEGSLVAFRTTFKLRTTT